MEISISKVSSDNHALHTHFRKWKVNDVTDIAAAMKLTWAPMMWSMGQRLSSLFQSAEVIGLDFDNGWTISEAVAYLKKSGYAGVIGTTKSHQLAKPTNSGGVEEPRDRFRMAMIMDKKIRDGRVYQYNMRKLEETFPAYDKACTDSARKFQPCSAIIYIQSGKLFPVDTSKEVLEALTKEQEAYDEYRDWQTAKIKDGILPAWISRAVMFGVRAGDRNKTIYKIAATLSAANWDMKAINLLIQNSKNLSELDRQEIRTTINSGWKCGRKKRTGRESYLHRGQEERESRS